MSRFEKGKKKLEYFWMYYKYQTGIVLLVAVLGLYLASVFVKADDRDTFQVMVINHTMDTEEKEELSEKAASLIDNRDVKVILDDSITMNLENEALNSRTGGAESVTTSYFAGDLDLLIAPKDVILHYAGLGGAENLQKALPKEQYKALAPHLLKGKNKEGETIDCAVLVKTWKNGDTEEPLYACVMKTGRHKEVSQKLLSCLGDFKEK